MRYRFVLFMCGMMTMLFGGFMMFPAFVDLWHDDVQNARIFFECAFFVLFMGAGIVWITKQEIHEKLSPQEMFLTTSSLWLCAAFISAIPLYLSPGCAGFTDAFFEAMSGLTTTGATTYTRLDTLPKGRVIMARHDALDRRHRHCCFGHFHHAGFAHRRHAIVCHGKFR